VRTGRCCKCPPLVRTAHPTMFLKWRELAGIRPNFMTCQSRSPDATQWNPGGTPGLRFTPSGLRLWGRGAVARMQRSGIRGHSRIAFHSIRATVVASWCCSPDATQWNPGGRSRIAFHSIRATVVESWCCSPDATQWHPGRRSRIAFHSIRATVVGSWCCVPDCVSLHPATVVESWCCVPDCVSLHPGYGCGVVVL